MTWQRAKGKIAQAGRSNLRQCPLKIRPQIFNLLEPNVTANRVFGYAETLVRIQTVG
jgi:hypothetical protein